MSSKGININISSDTVKWVLGGALFMGACYLIYKFLKDDEKIAKLPAEAETFATLPNLSPNAFDAISLHSRVKESARTSFETGEYVSAVRSASITLFDIIRERSGIDKDATDLIKHAFRGEPKKDVGPKLKFQNDVPGHVTNMGDGYIQMLEGFAKTIRKLHMHATVELTEEKALQEISLACYLASTVEKETIILSKNESIS